MVSMVHRMLIIADDLLADRPRSSAARRRAVSTAYYAAFHAFAKTCSDGLMPNVEIGSVVYERAYRALTHGALTTARDRQGPLKSEARFREILDLMYALRQGREEADYSPPDPDAMKLSAAREHIERAREIVDRLAELQTIDRETLAAYLLVKDFKERGRS